MKFSLLNWQDMLSLVVHQEGSTGCLNTPAYKSRCYPFHAPFTAITQSVQFSEQGSPVTDNHISVEEGHIL